MPYYQLPRLNEAVKWPSDQPRTLLRYTAGGGLVLLHVTADPSLTPKLWQTQPLQLGLVGTSLEPTPIEVPPVLCIRLGEWPVQAAPACIFELGEPEAIYDWLNARAVPADLRLVLLRLDPERPEVAILEASRRVWASEWATGDSLLRLRLEQQVLNTFEEDAYDVQQAGRKLVASTPAGELLLALADFRMDVAGESQGSLLHPAAKADELAK